MARMYSRKKGKSGSHRPKVAVATWAKRKPKEVEDIIVKLAKEGNSSARIGLIMRDQYGIPSAKLSKLKISKVMKDNSLYPDLPEDLKNLIRRAADLEVHLGKNKRDYISKRGLELTESKIRRLVKYYRSTGRLPKTWKWNLSQAKLLAK